MQGFLSSLCIAIIFALPIGSKVHSRCSINIYLNECMNINSSAENSYQLLQRSLAPERSPGGNAPQIMQISGHLHIESPGQPPASP